MGEMTQKPIRLVRNRPKSRGRVDRISRLNRVGPTAQVVPRQVKLLNGRSGLEKPADGSAALVGKCIHRHIAAQAEFQAKFEGGLSYYSFKRLVPGGAFKMGYIGVTCTALPTRPRTCKWC